MEMKKTNKLLNEPVARAVARFLTAICYLLIFIFAVGLVLSFVGRQTFILHTSTGTYPSAIYSETNRDWNFRGPTVGTNDEIRVMAADNDEVDLITQIGLSAMYAVNVIPLIFSFWLLSRVFSNISKGLIFTGKNASYLLYYGLIHIGVAVLVPFIKLFISFCANQFTSSSISIATGQNLFNNLIPSIAFIVAAYIIHYGIHLQDEVDHTL
jgi:hypothetical protein